MWPIEPVHYVAHAGPAELLFQAGSSDTQVPPPLALAFQNAGSQPKTVLWYQSGHALPFEHVLDELEWLKERIGIRGVESLPSLRLLLMGPAESFVRLNPETQGLALALDRSMLLWFVAVAGSIALVLRRGNRGAPGVNASWLLSTAFFGPLALVVRRALGRRSGSARDPAPPPALRALASTLWNVSFRLAGLIAAIAFLDRQRQLYESPLIVLLLVWGLPYAAGWGMHRWARTDRAEDGKPSTIFRRAISAHWISNHLVIAAALPTSGFLVSRWLYHWFPLPGWQVASAPFWAIAALSAFAAALTSFPAELWLLRSGRVEWGVASQPEASDRSPVSRLALGGAVGVTLLVMLFCFHWTFGYLL